MLRTITIPSTSGLTLRGILHLPANGKCNYAKMVILLPGLIGTRVGPHRILFDLAEHLSAHGIPTLRCDLNGGGYSDGDSLTLTFASLVQDVRDLIHYCSENYKTERFMLGGICRGARVALAASLNAPHVEELILLSCARFREDSLQAKIARRRLHHLKKYFQKFIEFKWFPRLLKGDLNFGLIRKAITYPIDLETLGRLNGLGDNSNKLGSLKARTIFIYGSKDPDQEDSISYYQEILCNKAPGTISLQIINGSDAGFYSTYWHREVMEKISDWLEGYSHE